MYKCKIYIPERFYHSINRALLIILILISNSCINDNCSDIIISETGIDGKIKDYRISKNGFFFVKEISNDPYFNIYKKVQLYNKTKSYILVDDGIEYDWLEIKTSCVYTNKIDTYNKNTKVPDYIRQAGKKRNKIESYRDHPLMNPYIDVYYILRNNGSINLKRNKGFYLITELIIKSKLISIKSNDISRSYTQQKYSEIFFTYLNFEDVNSFPFIKRILLDEKQKELLIITNNEIYKYRLALDLSLLLKKIERELR